MAFDNIKLEKSLYTTGKSFTAALEELDPSENYKGTSLEGLDAYERQLKRFDIKVSGKGSDSVSKFFRTSESAALFPEYVSRAVRTGLDYNESVAEIIASTTEIDSLDYRSVMTQLNLDNFELNYLDEGQSLPEFTIKLSEKLTKLKKHGKMLVASYEAIKFQKLDLFTTVLKQIGDFIAKSEFYQSIEAIGADSNINAIQSTNKALTFNDLLDLWESFNQFNMTTLMVSKKTLRDILAMPEFRDANAGLDFHATGNIVTPFGAKVIVSTAIDDKTVCAVDKNYALEKVQAGGITTEFDKLIDRQLERATISTITGFSVIYSDAIKILALAE